MSVKANKTAIGGFVVGAIALAAAAVIIFGGGELFSKSIDCVFNFEGNVSGLSKGAPIVLKGVKIGTVTDIELLCDEQTMEFRTRVVGETHGNVRHVNGDAFEERIAVLGLTEKEAALELINELVTEHGLRAQLVVQSMVTGQLAVSLDFHPDSEITLYGDAEMVEIPTIPTMLEELTETLGAVPFKQILEDVQLTLHGIEKIVNESNLAGSATLLNEMLKELVQVAKSINEQFPPVLAQIEVLARDASVLARSTEEKVIPGIEATLEETRSLVHRVDRRIDPLMDSIGKTADETRRFVTSLDGRVATLALSLGETSDAARVALEQAQGTLTLLQKGYVSEDSPLYHDLTKALEKLSEAMSSFHAVTDYLERHPEALLKGKPGE